MQPRQTEILLESGTNELEIMEFTIAGEVFGINVSKVREILRIMPVKPMQRAHPNIEGIFKPRDVVLTVIDLGGYLSLTSSQDPERDLFIVTNFNNQHFAFHVHTVVGIARISWAQMRKPERIIYGGKDGVATGIADYEGRLITILDFEKIVADISPDAGLRLSAVDYLGDRTASNRPVMLVEDSTYLAKIATEALRKAGYHNIIMKENGKDAWESMSKLRDSGEPIQEQIACIISDIEMPQMDGHHLTKLIKDDPYLRSIPVILFSSLISEEMRVKGIDVGADEQISKSEVGKLVVALDRLSGAFDVQEPGLADE